MPPSVDVTIDLLVGPEVVTGSTRLKAGTATKLVLNMITTTAMIATGKVYQNLMVDLTATCNKLVDRAHRIMTGMTDLEYDEATAILEEAGYHVKTALVMKLAGVGKDRAHELLDANDGQVEAAITANTTNSNDLSRLG